MAHLTRTAGRLAGSFNSGIRPLALVAVAAVVAASLVIAATRADLGPTAGSPRLVESDVTDGWALSGVTTAPRTAPAGVTDGWMYTSLPGVGDRQR